VASNTLRPKLYRASYLCHRSLPYFGQMLFIVLGFWVCFEIWAAVARTDAPLTQAVRRNLTIAGLILIGRIDGGPRGASWRVVAEAPGAPSDAATDQTLKAMLDELVHRVFTNLVSVGSRRWEAVKLYSEGLRTFRRTLTTQQDRKVHLYSAERLFIQALGKDNTFSRCHYNLGVVYSKLGKQNSSCAAYERALKESPTLSDAAYALSERHWSEQKYGESGYFSERGTRIDPDDARSWLMRGRAQLALMEERLGKSLMELRHDPEYRGYLRDAIETLEIAAALAWRRLCHEALTGQEAEKARATAALCLSGIGGAHLITGSIRRGAWILQQVPTHNRSAFFYYEIGKCWHDRRQFGKAAGAFRSALLIEGHPRFWARLSQCYAKLFAQSKRQPSRLEAIEAYHQALDCPSEIDKEALGYLADACTVLEQADRALAQAGDADLHQAHAGEDAKLLQRTADVSTVQSGLERGPKEDEGQWIKRLEDWYDRLKQELDVQQDLNAGVGWGWPFAFVALRLADCLENYPFDRAKVLYGEALAKLMDHPREIIKQELYRRLAEMHSRDDLPAALKAAKQAVEVAPQSSAARRVLGHIYLRLKDYERAKRELLMAFDLDPSATTINQIALLHAEWGVALLDKQKRREAFERVIKAFGDAFDALEDEVTDPKVGGPFLFVTGVLYFGLMELEKAAYYLGMARAADFKPLESRVYLGRVYMWQGAYNEAESVLREFIAEAKRYVRKARSTLLPAETWGEASHQ
jgi:tetratricopeptide (TPR) repeat protein